MVKHYNEQHFNFINLKGEEFPIHCYTTHTRQGFCHTAYFDNDCVKISYINRTWERFNYESALYKFIDKYYKGVEADGLKQQVEAIANHEKIEADKWFDRMKGLYDNISDEGKKVVSKAVDDNNINTKEDMEYALKLAVVLGM